jgi:iron complex outermembrane receptor protein
VVPGTGSLFADTYDAEFQHSMTVGTRHRLVWGMGARLTDYRIDGSPGFFFDPPGRELFLANGFVQDSFSLSPKLTLIAGLKLEKNPYAGVSLLPELRVAWKPAPTTLIWGAVSRAVRSPTPFDVDVRERAGLLTLSGNPEFRTEKLTAFELGLRIQPTRTFSLSATAYYHRYDDLRSVEITPGPGLNLIWGNGLKGNSYGLDAWADWRPTRWWTLSAGVTLIEQKFRSKPGASGLLGVAQLGTDPSHQFKLRSSVNVGSQLKLDLDFRAVASLPNTSVPAYQELGGRIAWLATPGVTLSVSGSNLLHDDHQEYPGGGRIPRKVMGGLELRF